MVFIFAIQIPLINPFQKTDVPEFDHFVTLTLILRPLMTPTEHGDTQTELVTVTLLIEGVAEYIV